MSSDFPISVNEVISMSNSDKDAIQKAINTVGLAEYDRKLVRELSGGQKQRLAIARALFAEPKILIMDEPTSHLDTLSEAMIQKALEDISKEKTLTKIVIAHRLSTVQKADQILVMDKGKIAEKGTHTELLKQKGIYASIVAQSELKP
jgi:ABC-type multidrug transport system fused ATPase/permease subunit